MAATWPRYCSATARLNSCGLPGVPGVQTLGWFGPPEPGSRACHSIPEAHDVEAQALHLVLRPVALKFHGCPGIGVGDVGRVLVDDVDAVEEHHAPVRVIEVGTARGAQEARDVVCRAPARRAPLLTGTAPRTAQRHDVRD